MTEMVDRVARAIAESDFGHSNEWAVEITIRAARAAIEAMREPTDEMATCQMATCYNTGPYGDKEVRRIYRAMIGEALRV